MIRKYNGLNRELFGKELKKRVIRREDLVSIGEWAYTISLDYDVDSAFRRILLTLTAMELGPEFAFTYEKLEQIADDLIAGKDVKL
jgi:hypothetical protein